MIGGGAVLFVSHDIGNCFLVHAFFEADCREGVARRVGDDVRYSVFVDGLVVHSVSPVANVDFPAIGR